MKHNILISDFFSDDFFGFYGDEDSIEVLGSAVGGSCSGLDFNDFGDLPAASTLRNRPLEGDHPKSKAAPAENRRQPKNTVVTENTLLSHLQDTFRIAQYEGFTFIQHDGVWVPVSGDSVGTLLLNSLPDHLLSSFRIQQAEAVARRILLAYSKRPTELIAPPNTILFQNGCFNILTQERVTPCWNWFFPYSVNACYNPEDYVGCPFFDRFIAQMANDDQETIDLLMAFLAFCLLPGVTKKKLFVLGPAPDSGKSHLADFLQYLLGNGSTSSISLTDLDNEFQLAGIFGKSINFSMELPAGPLSAKTVNAVKALSGGDSIRINRKFEHPFDFRPYAKLVCGTNHQLSICRPDNAFWRRVHPIPCLRSVPPEDQDEQLLDKLKSEADAIVVKLMDSARQLVQNSFEFPHCQASDLLKHQWQRDSIPGLARFLDEQCEFSPSYRVWNADLYSAFCAFCLENSVEPPTNTRFVEALKVACPDLRPERWSKDGVQGRGYCGMKLRHAFSA